MTQRDTIAAIATPAGRGGIGIVRMSGPALEKVAREWLCHNLPPRTAVLTRFNDAQGAAIDEGIALYFPAPQSYTGEDVLELHGHGGPVVLRMLLQRCLELGARIAEPGEFTQRAFLNGKLDLAQAEAVADLIDASTEQAARSAVRSLRGEFSKQIQSISIELTALRGLLEASLDFPEEEIDLLEAPALRGRLERLSVTVERVLGAARQGSLLREGVSIVLAGRPNVGKSSLLNQLAGDDLAIVTEIAGTTRDAIRQTIDLDGISAQIVDTAGLRETADPVEHIGVERAWKAIGDADAVIVLIDATCGTTPADEAILAGLPPGVPRVRVMNKIDLIGREPEAARVADGAVVWLSAKTGAGVDGLRRKLLEVVGWEGQSQGAYLARERHVVGLRMTLKHLRLARSSAQPELIAEELRLGHRALSALTGEFTADDLLGEIFSKFCIGK